MRKPSTAFGRSALVHPAISYMVCCAQRYPILLSSDGPESTGYGLLQSEELKFSPSRHIPFKPDGTAPMPTKTLGFWPRS